ncbi:MAG: hypothetical protein ACI9Y1_000687 [Lentisphaeria bacterium]|jgi:hypothetical protein
MPHTPEKKPVSPFRRVHKTPYIIDIEASGFGASSYPVEVGLAMQDGSRFCALIKPTEYWTHWDKSAESMHHISREMIIKDGKAVEEVAAELNSRLKGKIVYSDGWVVDERWLIQLFEAAQMKCLFQFYDIETILSETQMNAWHKVKAIVAVDLNLQRHRASNDASIIQRTYQKTHDLGYLNQLAAESDANTHKTKASLDFL